MTGLVFARFSRPTSRILWARRAVITPRNGVPTLQFRLANERGNNVIEATMSAGVLLREVSAEGEQLARMHDLMLVRSRSPLFALTFTGMHVIDATSPLYGYDAERLAREDVRVYLNMTGLDATFGQTIHAVHLYLHEDIDWNHRYVDVLENNDDGALILHLEHFHETKPILR